MAFAKMLMYNVDPPVLHDFRGASVGKKDRENNESLRLYWVYTCVSSNLDFHQMVTEHAQHPQAESI